MSDYKEIFRTVWQDFTRIIDLINNQCKETSFLVSQGESDPIFAVTHKGLINQAKEAVWCSYNNEKKVKKYYYKFENILRSIENSLLKVSNTYLSCLSLCSQLQASLDEYQDKQLPKFLLKVKETGNHFKIQVNKLIWREDETADEKSNSSSKQPQIFFSNNIASVPCKKSELSCCNSQKKTCPKTLDHFKSVFELTSLVFSNINNLSRTILFIKLSIEKFESSLKILQSLTQYKLSYYQGFSKEAKDRISNEKLFKIILRFIKIQQSLQSKAECLATYVNIITEQISYCSSTCIPIYFPLSPDKRDISSAIQKILLQTSVISSFIAQILSQKKHSQSAFIQEKSFLFIIFHFRSILLTKLQPYSSTLNLRHYSNLLCAYLKDLPRFSAIPRPISIKFVNTQKSTKIPVSPNRASLHSFNSSWDVQEDSLNQNPGFDEELEYARFRRSKKQMTAVSRTPDFSPLTVQSSMKKSMDPCFEIHSAILPNLQSTRIGTAALTEPDDRTSQLADKLKRIKNMNTGLLNYRIREIQNNRSISPLDKIRGIQEEFLGSFKAQSYRLRSSFIKLKTKEAFLYTFK